MSPLVQPPRAAFVVVTARRYQSRSFNEHRQRSVVPFTIVNQSDGELIAVIICRLSEIDHAVSGEAPVKMRLMENEIIVYKVCL